MQLFFSKTSNDAKKFSRLYKQNNLRRVYRGIYTDDLEAPLAVVVKKNWMDIVKYIVPKGILSFRTALDLKPTPYNNNSIVFITSTYNKTIILPGLVIKILKANIDLYIEQVLPNLFRSNIPRMLLENLTTIRKKDYKNIKTIGKKNVELYLAKKMRSQKEERLNRIKDEAKEIAKKLNYNTEYNILSQIISALLSTHKNSEYLNTDYAKAIIKKQPYDYNRLKLFEELYIYLKKNIFITRPYEFKKKSFLNISFFESYFSNFIEGTEFVIDEAEDIVFKNTEINHRHADSHDILANFNLTNNLLEISRTPSTAQELIDLLTQRHAYIMKARPDKNPGKFKQINNRAGSTIFVNAEDIIGTLYKSFDFYYLLNPGTARAFFMHFLISEVHPFDDGNGRISRIMMNSELASSNQIKIIIPTVHRDNYLNGLRGATRNQNFFLYCKVMDQAQAYCTSIPWADYAQAREKIETDCAEKIPDEGLPIFNRSLRQLQLSELVP